MSAHARLRRRGGSLAVVFTFLGVIAFGLGTPGHAHGSDSDLEDYRAVVAAYRSGDAAAALRSITSASSWPAQRLVDTTSRLWGLNDSERQDAGWTVTALSAACVMHMDALLSQPGHFAPSHLQVARAHLAGLRRLEERRGPSAAVGGREHPSPLLVEVHRAFVLCLHGLLRLEDLQRFLDELPASLGSRTPFLLAKGTLYELFASHRLEAARRAALVPGRDESLRKAERLLRQAHAGSPELAEVRLRLAHVLVQQGRSDEAVTLLQPLLAGPADRDTRYLAWLFLGQAHDGAGRRERAEQAFSSALAERACGQAAATALAHLAFRDRRKGAARRMVAEASSSSDCTDPWAWYDDGQADEFPGLIAALRETVRR